MLFNNRLRHNLKLNAHVPRRRIFHRGKEIFIALGDDGRETIPAINPNVDDIGNAIEFSATPVLIQSDGGQLTIQGVDDGTPIYIYTSAGIQAGSTVSKAGTASIPTSMKPGSIAIVKIGSKSVKVVIK